MTAEAITPEQRALAIIPPNYRAETAQTGVMPSMDMVLSSRCAGGLRDAIAAAIRAAETAAVEAERERCAEDADALGAPAVAACLREFGRTVALRRSLRRTPTTEADNHG